ncbi:ABC transporter ATP-binding protein [Salinibacterium sp. UTAS2018]|uniref:ABC transporter ATP-binding protein n=1 Tax=unclassified Salinibacterium TaxID=2632331 RepID=UPI0010097F00|nr:MULTISPECIES: ABC transporter ATP-binding protein [unclassified Salinibacterium]MBH0007873.1 ABC transporter ATP-binding protein [Salinibacterium sp. SWN1162]QAV70781.1 ABC transporter ATP-binding protein [Salinibacterium sp. UTAS2018]
MSLLEVRDVIVDYKTPGRRPVRAVAGASLEVGPGEIVGLVGESGCGKSTLGRGIVGLQKLTSGSVTLNGIPVSPVGRRARPKADRGLQMVFQDPYSSLNPRRRIWRQIADGLTDTSSDSSARAAAVVLLEAVGLSAAVADRYPHEFSGGQRQRIAIARALAPQPSVIVADEAVSALDASTQAQIANLLVGLAKERGMGLLFISHDLSVVRHIADKVAVMYLGRIVETAPTDELWESRLHPYTDALVRAIPSLEEDAAAPVAPDGEVPDPAAPPTGCRFHPRCPVAMDRCSTEDPSLVMIDDSRAAACWHQPAGGPAVRLELLATRVAEPH